MKVWLAVIAGQYVIRTDDVALLADSQFMLHEVLLHYLVTGEHPPYFDSCSRLVAQGLGRYADTQMKQVVVDEPICIIAAARWFTESPVSITDVSYIHKVTVPCRPHSLAPFLALYFAHAFDGERLLSDIFTFPGHVPSWAAQTARIVTIQRRKKTLSSTAVKVSDLWHGSTPLATRAKSLDHCLAWFRHLKEQETSAFCIPHSTNADLIFVLKLANGTHIWIVLQSILNIASSEVPKDTVEDVLTRLLPQNMLFDDVSFARLLMYHFH